MSTKNDLKLETLVEQIIQIITENNDETWFSKVGLINHIRDNGMINREDWTAEDPIRKFCLLDKCVAKLRKKKILRSYRQHHTTFYSYVKRERRNNIEEYNKRPEKVFR